MTALDYFGLTKNATREYETDAAVIELSKNDINHGAKLYRSDLPACLDESGHAALHETAAEDSDGLLGAEPAWPSFCCRP